MIAKYLKSQKIAGLFDENRVAGTGENQRRQVQALRTSACNEELISGDFCAISLGQKGRKRCKKSLIALQNAVVEFQRLSMIKKGLACLPHEVDR